MNILQMCTANSKIIEFFSSFLGMDLKIVVGLLLVLCQLGQRLLSQHTTAGYIYQLVHGKDNDDDVSAFAKFTAYIDCWQDDSCLYVAKEKRSGTFVLMKTGEMLNNDKYFAVWKKNSLGRQNIYFL